MRRRIKLNRKLSHLMECRDQYEFILFDVREDALYRTGHIPGAVSFPLNEMNYLPVEDMFLTIVIVGQDSKDTRMAADYLSSNGYFNVIPFGSIAHWKGPLETDRALHISQIPPTKELHRGEKINSSLI
ncbi:MAG: rhodanese-like domain-containing protein [Spirochaetales bacterium]|nr:rhodanese-like domain-containing protein [Spirochaetales bacterium]